MFCIHRRGQLGKPSLWRNRARPRMHGRTERTWDSFVPPLMCPQRKAAGAPGDLGIGKQLRHRLGRAATPHSELRRVVKKEALCKSLIQLCSEKLPSWLNNPKRTRQPRETDKREVIALNPHQEGQRLSHMGHPAWDWKRRESLSLEVGLWDKTPEKGNGSRTQHTPPPAAEFPLLMRRIQGQDTKPPREL